MYPNDPFPVESPESFASKQKELDDVLDAIERNVRNQVVHERSKNVPKGYLDYLHERSLQETKYLQGRESLFKRPEAPISRCLPRGRVPDFRKNPHKWKKYSLDDVRDEDMSERGNKAAAMTFLREIEDRKNTQDESMEDVPSKITFNKAVMIKEEESVDDDEKSKFRNSKVIMQEYVVGQKVKKEKKNKEKRAGGSKQLKLDHLVDGEDEAEDN